VGPQFPYGMRNTMTTYVSSVSTDIAAYEDLTGHHLLAVRNLITIINNESYHGSASELSPVTSHGYTMWDFSGVPDLVMFQRFLDTADYWFGCSDDSSIGSYDPARECFVVVNDEHADSVNRTGAGDGDTPQNPGPSAPPPHRQEASASTRSWPKRASSRPSSRKSTGRCDSCVPPSREKAQRACSRCILVHQTCSLHFVLDLIMELNLN
jgi:hypothetical protein